MLLKECFQASERVPCANKSVHTAENVASLHSSQAHVSLNVGERSLRQISNPNFAEVFLDNGIGENQSRAKDHESYAAQHEQSFAIAGISIH